MIELKIDGKVELQASGEVHVGKNIHATVIIRPDGKMKVTVNAEKNSCTSIYVIQEKSCELELANNLEQGAKMKTYGIWLSGGQASVVDNMKKNADARETHIIAAKGKNKIALNTVLRHLEANTKGDILVRGTVDDSAIAKADGMIKIDKKGKDAESFLAQHLILLSPDARAVADPKLEIENNEVSSRHGASVSQVDEKKIFYLMARGLKYAEARELIADGFLSTAIERLENEEMKKEFLGKLMGT